VQSALREAKEEAVQQFLFQSLVVTLGMAEALSDFIKAVGQYAQRRHAELKQMNETLAAQHTDTLKSGQELLEKLKANPSDRALRKEIDRVQQSMESIQRNLKRGANALQRDVAPGLAMIDQMADSIRRVSEAEQLDALKRLLKTIIGQVRELYAGQPSVPTTNLMDVVAWEKTALTEIDQAAGFHDAYARAGYQAVLALEWMVMAMAENPPESAGEATLCANEAVAARLRQITARFTSN
jgi:thymidylate synthase